MGRWDNRKSENGFTGQISVKTIIILIVVMVVFWILLVGLSTIQIPINCIEINKIIDSSQFYELDNETQLLYKELCRSNSNIIIK